MSMMMIAFLASCVGPFFGRYRMYLSFDVSLLK